MIFFEGRNRIGFQLDPWTFSMWEQLLRYFWRLEHRDVAAYDVVSIIVVVVIVIISLTAFVHLESRSTLSRVHFDLNRTFIHQICIQRHAQTQLFLARYFCHTFIIFVSSYHPVFLSPANLLFSIVIVHRYTVQVTFCLIPKLHCDF